MKPGSATFLDRLAALEPSAFRRFLRAQGWSEASPGHGRSFLYRRDTPRGAVEVEIPSSPALVDYTRRLAEAVEILALVDDVPPDDLLRAIAHPSIDLVRFRYTGDETSDGTLSLDDSIRIRSARRQLFLAVAHSVVEPLPHFPRLARSEPLEFLQKCREAPTRPGSFISEVMVPVSPAVGDADLDAPFARKTTELLSRALSSASAALERGDDSALLQSAREGLGANSLAALADLRPPGERGALEVTFRWASSRPRPTIATPTIRLGANLFEPLGEAARVLRETSDVPGYELEGFVARLQRAPANASEPGEVVITAVIEGRPGASKIHMVLPPGLYGLAVEAHRNAARIRVTGTLRRQGRRLVLGEAGGLVLVDAVDE